jgi:hypothetical protein
MVGSFAGCCARAASGHAAAPDPASQGRSAGYRTGGELSGGIAGILQPVSGAEVRCVRFRESHVAPPLGLRSRASYFAESGDPYPEPVLLKILKEGLSCSARSDHCLPLSICVMLIPARSTI